MRALPGVSPPLYSWHVKVTYGTIPKVATADGSDRIPKEMVSATITIEWFRNHSRPTVYLSTHASHSSYPAIR